MKKPDSALLSKVNANVLIIGDIDITGVIEISLMREGYGVHLIRSAAALAWTTYIYDVIVLDLLLPGMELQEFIQRTGQKWPRCELVLVAANEQVEATARGFGIRHWVGKPFKPEDLVNVVRRCRS